MGLTRKMMSLFSMGAVDFRSDKERTAAYTRGIRRQSRQQTQILKQQSRDAHAYALACEAEAARAYASMIGDDLPRAELLAQQRVTCAVGPCDELRVNGTSYCAKHGPAWLDPRRRGKIAKGKP